MSRTLSVECSAIPLLMGEPALVPVELSGRDAINELFEYELLLQTPDALNPFVSQAADFDLDAFIGQPMVCRIELEDGVPASIREINALVTAAEVLGEEGRQVQYRLTLRPWLFLSTLRTDCRIFQDRTVVQILDEVLGSYPYPVVQRLYGPAGGQDERYPSRDYQTQFNESDFAFFSRLCQEWGINYHFEHAGGQHRLVLSDATAERKREGVREVPFHAPGWKTDREYLYSAVPVHHLTSGAYATRDHDYRQPRADLAVARRDPRPTAHAGLEVYQWHAPLAGSHYAQPDADPADPRGGGGQLALLRMQALRTAGARLRARGAMRGMVPGENFTLQGHPRLSANDQYLILATTFVLEDVGQASQVGAAARDRRLGWRVHVELIAHPVQEVLRPLATQPKPQCAGPQVACVVGPAGQDLWTDDLGRIRVQFPWDRRGREDERSSCWLRVASPWAGNQLGAIQLPRIGQEVLVDFIGGDPDLPICTGRVANAMNLPPWKLPSQSALSGLRSRELVPGRGNGAGGRSNHLVLDDTAQKIQAQLQSDHACSTLSLGHITRIAGNAGRTDERGQGFELRTDAHGAIRAQQGLLITTEARPNAQAHVLDSAETEQRLREAGELHRHAAEIAQRNKGQEAGDQAEVARLLQSQGDAVRGSGSGTATSGTFPELAQPHLVLASPAGIATTSQHGTHLASAEHTAITSGKHTSIVSGDSVLAVALRAIKLFAAEQDVQILAAQAEVQIEALKRSIAMAAKEEITLKADRIVIEARSELIVQGGGSYARYQGGGIESGTPGSDVRHAATHSAAGPASRGSPSLPASVKQGPGPLAVSSIYSALDPGRRGLAGTSIQATDVLGKVGRGVLDAQGNANISGLAPGGARVEFGKSPRQPWDVASYFGQPAWPRAALEPATAPTASQLRSSMVQAAWNYPQSLDATAPTGDLASDGTAGSFAAGLNDDGTSRSLSLGTHPPASGDTQRWKIGSGGHIEDNLAYTGPGAAQVPMAAPVPVRSNFFGMVKESALTGSGDLGVWGDKQGGAIGSFAYVAGGIGYMAGTALPSNDAEAALVVATGPMVGKGVGLLTDAAVSRFPVLGRSVGNSGSAPSAVDRAQVLANIGDSRAASASSNFGQFAKAEGQIQAELGIWPPNSGGYASIYGKTLEVGTQIDRFGYPGGTYLSPLGASFESRALPSSYVDTKPYFQYEVVHSITDVTQAKALPWFGQPGMGTQFQLPNPVQHYLDNGFLKVIEQ